MIEIKDYLLTNRKNRPALRNPNWYAIRKLKGVVAHWTANTGRGAHAVANRNYFNTVERYASAHYLVDDHSIVRCVPDDEVAYHVGGRFYKPDGERLMEEGLTPNYFLIGFEMCVNEDGDWGKTYGNSVGLAQYLLNKYNLGINDLYRHYDITGKLCPQMMIEEADWQVFKNHVKKGLTAHLSYPLKKGFVNTADLNVRTGPGAGNLVVKRIFQDKEISVFEVEGNWFRIGDDEWVHKHYIEITFEKMFGIVRDPTRLNVRIGPGGNYQKVDALDDGTEVEIYDQAGNWYNIGPDRWVYAKFVEIMEVKKGRVTAPFYLNVRRGPGTNYKKVAQLDRDAMVEIFEIEGNWFRVGEEEWVFGSYVELV